MRRFRGNHRAPRARFGVTKLTMRTVFFDGLLVAFTLLVAQSQPKVSAKFAPVPASTQAPPAIQSLSLPPAYARPQDLLPRTPFPSAYQPALTYRGYRCTVDCSGHEAGYEWAEQHAIDDEDDCGGNSQSFIEGCIAHVREQASGASDEDSDEE